jgi:hypothetical protein
MQNATPVNVTTHPTAEWTGQQLREAFRFDQLPRYVLRDRDGIFGDDFREQVRDMGISEATTRKSPCHIVPAATPEGLKVYVRILPGYNPSSVWR